MSDSIRDSLASSLGTGYTLGRELGGGGMSRVWTARDEALGRDVVVKLLSPDLVEDLSVERFAREVRLAATLQHAHIVPLLTAGVTSDGRPYYLMPFVEGESLRAQLSRPDAAQGLPINEVVSALRDVSRALAYAHARGIVHRDIKPDNVLLSGGAAMVADFGIAKAMVTARAASDTANTTLTRNGVAIGTPAYQSPEQGAGDPGTDHRTDIYAFGVMAYELLTGSTPFVNRSVHELLLAHLTEMPVDVRSVRAGVPPAVAALVMSCLAKDPDHRPGSAAALTAALTGELSPALSGLGTRTPARVTPSLHATRSRRIGAALAVAVVLAGAVGVFRYDKRTSGVDRNLMAVMPFTVRNDGMGLWREGLVDILSRSLDGAGTLRTVAASTTISRAPQLADPQSAASLGRELGAGLVLFGSVSEAGTDSVHLRFAIYDVPAARVRADFDLRGTRDRMDALADSMALRVLREIGAGGVSGSSRTTGLGTRSLPALKAFLAGQQLYRRGALDSARVAYTRAVDADSTFALAWRGIAATFIREGRENEAEAIRALVVAIRLRAGHGPRDSLLLLADSLRLAFKRRTPGATDAVDDIQALQPMFATLRQAVRAYPSDAELWIELGDAAFHFGQFGDVTEASAAEWLREGVRLDSTFIVPHVHLLELAERHGNTRDASRAAGRVAAISGSAPMADYYRLVANVLDTQPLSRSARRQLDSLPTAYTAAIIREFFMMPDTGGIALQLARTLQKEPLRNRKADDDSVPLRDAIAYALAGRGRAREAIALSRDRSLLLRLARIGAIPADSALQRARRWLESEPAEAMAAASLFAAARDTAALRRLVTWADSADEADARKGGPVDPGFTPGLHGYRALAAGDTATALQRLLSVPMATCNDTPCDGNVIGALLASRGEAAKAIRVLDRWRPRHGRVDTPHDWLQRAQLAERTGDITLARTLFQQVVTMWSSGDEALRPAVSAARAGLARIDRR